MKQNVSVLPLIFKEAKQNAGTPQSIILVSAVVCQNTGSQFDVSSVVEVHGVGEILIAELKQLMDFAKNPVVGRKTIYQFNKMLYFSVHEHSNSIFFIDLSGQFILSLSYGDADRCAIMCFKADELCLVQDFAVRCEQFLMEKAEK